MWFHLQLLPLFVALAVGCTNAFAAEDSGSGEAAIPCSCNNGTQMGCVRKLIVTHKHEKTEVLDFCEKKCAKTVRNGRAIAKMMRTYARCVNAHYMRAIDRCVAGRITDGHVCMAIGNRNTSDKDLELDADNVYMYPDYVHDYVDDYMDVGLVGAIERHIDEAKEECKFHDCVDKCHDSPHYYYDYEQDYGLFDGGRYDRAFVQHCSCSAGRLLGTAHKLCMVHTTADGQQQMCECMKPTFATLNCTGRNDETRPI